MINQFNREHRKFEEDTLDDCYIGQEPWIDYFERYYVAEYNSFSKPFRLTRRIKEFKAGKKIEYSYQVVYKTPSGKNAPSPLRAYLVEVNRKIDDAFKYGIRGSTNQHLKDHLKYKLYKKHTDSLRAYIRSKTGK